MILRTRRLILRKWSESDREPFALMNAHKEVMRDLGGPISRKDSDNKFDRFAKAFDKVGYGRWLIESPDGDFLGYCGVMPGIPGHPLGVHNEIGWRLVKRAWGHGYATEAAKAALTDAFERIGLPEVLAITTECNYRSKAVMDRLGLERDESRDFHINDELVGKWQGLVWVAAPKIR